MKLKDFLKEFEGADPEAEMVFQMQDGCCDQEFDLDKPEIYADESKQWTRNSEGKQELVKSRDQFVTLRFPALVYFSSCIKSGTMKDHYNKLFDSEGKWRK